MSIKRFAILAVLLTACVDSTAGEAGSLVGGPWRYTGSQDAPTIAQLDGSLSWSGVSSAVGAFEGTFSITELAAAGQQRTLAGTSAGQVVADSIVDFDIDASGLNRHHLGILRGDSITGMWTEVSGNSASGRFVLHRNVAALR